MLIWEKQLELFLTLKKDSISGKNKNPLSQLRENVSRKVVLGYQ